MPRPKKAPRERLQITLSKPVAKRLRAFAKRLDRDISEVVEAGSVFIMDNYREVPPGGLVVDIPKPNPPR